MERPGDPAHSGSIGSERVIYPILALLVFIYICLRASLIPWVHDESATIYWYVEREQFLPYRSLWDAGNHFLSTGIGVLGHKLWGLSLPGSRIGSILAFPTYAWAAYRIGQQLTGRWLRWCAWAALIACPFLLDFFSLFRGYALGMAFWLVAIDGGIRYAMEPSGRRLIQLLLGMFLADMAVLSLVPLWTLIVVVTGLWLLLQWRNDRSGFPKRQLLIWVVFGVLPLLFGWLLAWEMRRRGLLYHGTTEGFIPVTLASLARFVVGNSQTLGLIVISAITITASIVIPLMRPRRIALMLLSVALWADIAMRIAMALILDVNYPEDRAALHMVPLTILILAFAGDTIASRSAVAKIAAMTLLLFLPLRTVYTANLTHTMLWPEQSVPTRFLQHIEELQQHCDRPLLIGAYHQLSIALPYADRIHGLSLSPPDVNGFPHGPHDVRIVDDRFIEAALEGYHEVDHDPGSGLHLLLPDRTLNTRSSSWLGLPDQLPMSEYYDLWNGDTLTGPQDLLIEVKCEISSKEEFLNMSLVLSLEQEGHSLYHHTIPTAFIRREWNGDHMHVIVRIPWNADATSRKVYFWDPEHAGPEVTNCAIRIHQVIDAREERLGSIMESHTFTTLTMHR